MRSSLVAAVAWLVLGAFGAEAFDHPGGAQTIAQIEEARAAIEAGIDPWASAYPEIVQFGIEGLGEVPSPVEVFDPPGEEDPVLNEVFKDNLKGDVEAAYYCALVYALSDDLDPVLRAAYAQKTVDILKAWAQTTVIISGGNVFQEAGNLMMAVQGSAFLLAYELTADYGGWDPVTRNQFRLWVAFRYRPAMIQIMDASGNKGAWGLYAAMLADHVLDDVPGLEARLARLREIIDQQIEPDGFLPDALNRGDKSFWYTYYTLAPMTHAVELVRNDLDLDLYSEVPPSGGTIRQALDTFLDGFLNPAGWPGPPQVLVAGVPDDWGQNLLFAMGQVYAEPAYLAAADTPLGRRNGAWKEADLLVPASGTAVPSAGPAGLAALALGLGAGALGLLTRRGRRAPRRGRSAASAASANGWRG